MSTPEATPSPYPHPIGETSRETIEKVKELLGAKALFIVYDTGLNSPMRFIREDVCAHNLLMIIQSTLQHILENDMEGHHHHEEDK
jgi:hypothetical protein